MNYKRYWLALAVVILGSFAVLGTVGRKMISQAPPIPDVYSATDNFSLPVPQSRMDRVCGSRLAARRSARSGDMALMLLRIGAPTGCIASRTSFSTTGHSARARRILRL